METACYHYVVFTNGVFDMIHPGHIDLLDYARSQGDCLVVGVNDDDSVKRLKGPMRPIFPLSERMEVLAAIQYVDYVIPFSEDTPLELIRGLPPVNVLVKGGDYRAGDVVGRSEVISRGGRLCIYSFKHTYSTSKLIDQIKSNRD